MGEPHHLTLPPAALKTLRYTAQLIVSATEACVAVCVDRTTLGPNGEPRIACLLHTTDAGAHWALLPWRRSFLSRARFPGFPTWPPERVLTVGRSDAGLLITHQDEWVPFEPGGESLWESTFDGRSWRVRKVREMDYDGADNPVSDPPIALSFPGSMQPPSEDVLARCEAHALEWQK